MYKIMRSGQQKRLKRMYADLAKVTGRKNGFGRWFSSSPKTQPTPNPFQKKTKKEQQAFSAKMAEARSRIKEAGEEYRDQHAMNQKVKQIKNELQNELNTAYNATLNGRSSKDIENKITLERHINSIKDTNDKNKISQIRELIEGSFNLKNKLPTIWEE